MRISQRDIAHLSDAELKRTILAVTESIEGIYDPYPAAGVASFWQVLVAALHRALKERTTTLALLADDGNPGSHGGDPV